MVLCWCCALPPLLPHMERTASTLACAVAPLDRSPLRSKSGWRRQAVEDGGKGEAVEDGGRGEAVEDVS
jgi:hypothetical protein